MIGLGAAPMRILLVEDHASLSRQVEEKLHRAGYSVDSFTLIEDATQALDLGAYALALIDRRLPDGDGVSLVPRIRQKQPDMRILMLTALDAVDDRIEGLEAGADDYLTKPFNLDEMIARIRANLRKHAAAPAPPARIGAISFDLDQRAVFIADKQTIFSRRELILLEALVRRANCVVSRECLHAELYGYGEEVQDHALTSLVSRLRTRLDALGAGAEIRSARALGYILRETKNAKARE
jgi:two-component system, OmpR family, response regulator